MFDQVEKHDEVKKNNFWLEAFFLFKASLGRTASALKRFVKMPTLFSAAVEMEISE